MDPTPSDAPSLPALIKTYLARFTNRRPASHHRYFREVRCFSKQSEGKVVTTKLQPDRSEVRVRDSLGSTRNPTAAAHGAC